MDEYAREIRDLQVEVQQLVEAEEEPKTIVELETQIDVLGALYRRTQELYDVGQVAGELREALAVRGYGDWSFDSVYAFVYDAAVDIPAENPREFLGVINRTDFRALLELRALEP